jgi:hypothetical protein
MLLLAFLALTLIAIPGVAEPQYHTRIVDSDGGLRLRSSPDLNAAILTVIPNGSEVEVLDEKPDVLAISGKKGKWTKVDTGNGVGWVFGGFLADSRSLLKKLAASYDAVEPVEPGDAPTWLSISESIISSGYSGAMEANWYCLVANVTRQDDVYTIEGITDRKPTKDEIHWLANEAQAKESLSIVAVAPDTIGIGDLLFKRRR